MNPTEIFLLALGIGSALIAFWLVVRFPSRGPGDLRKALLHVAAALAIGWFAPNVFGIVASGDRLRTFVAIFFLLFPILIYMFLSGAWFLKLAHDAFGQQR